MKRPISTAFAVFLALTLSACAAPPVPAPAASVPPAVSAPEEMPETPPQPPADPKAEQIDALLAAMTPEEKVGQLFFVRCPADRAAEDAAEYHLGGYILFGRDTKDKTAGALIETLRGYQAAAEIPLLIGVDEEGGTVVRVSSNPHLRSRKFPAPQKLFADGGMDAILADTAEKDALLSALGFNVNLAPVADVSTAAKDFIYPRAFGQDAAATAEYTAAVTAQMAADGMGSVLKHFPGYGNNVDTHTGIAVDKRPMETFMASDLLPFSAGIDAAEGFAAVLVSHNIVECMDADLPASLSPAVHRLLREELGDTCVVMTDDLAMDAVAAYAKDGSAVVLSLQAGNDLVLTSDYRTQIPQVLAALSDGTLDADLVDTACRRVLVWKQALGLLPPV